MDTLVVGYGTLLYQESLAKTVGQEGTAGKVYHPVTVPGFRRLCNVRPTHYQPSFHLSREPIEAGALNVEISPGHSVNGLAFAVSPQELALLDTRERYYERRRCTVHRFASPDPLGDAFIYLAPPDAVWIERDPARLLPRWEDVIWPRTGAYRISDGFGRFYDASTYLADGRTLLVDYYRRWLEPPPPDPTVST